MFQNMKVDIVYYKTNSDFEMEFNLCGCCRMRLLTDKATDRKLMVHSLARAVSRSRIIMVVGPLFGEEGSIVTTASAIGSSLEKVDNKLYGLKTDAPINIIAGATPLVTPDGFFGGCIIERGPQTMILLSESRTVRKTVMESLIHPYISELYAIELKSKAESIIENNNETANVKKATETAIPEVVEDVLSAVAETEIVSVAETVSAAVTAATAVAETANLVSNAVEVVPTEITKGNEQDDFFLGSDDADETDLKDNGEIVLITDEEEAEVPEEKIDLIDEIFDDDVEVEPISDDITLLHEVDTTYEIENTDEDIELVENNIGDSDPVPFEIATLVYDENQNAEEEQFLAEIQNIEKASEDIITEFDDEVAEDFFYTPETERELVSIVPEVEVEEIFPEETKLTQDDEIFDEDDSIEKKITALNVPIMVLTILLFVLISAMCVFIFVLPKAGGISSVEYIKNIFETLFK